MSPDRGGAASFHRGLAFAFLGLAAVVQFFLAGLGAFGATSFDAHEAIGTILTVVALVLAILAFVGRREALQASLVLLGLMILQNILGVAGEDVGVLGGLHAVNGLLILFAAHQAARALPIPGLGAAPRTTVR